MGTFQVCNTDVQICMVRQLSRDLKTSPIAGQDVAEDMREAVQGSMQLRRMRLDMHAAYPRLVSA